MAENEKISTECPRCGNVILGVGQVRCAVEPDGELGLCEFNCPYCEGIVLVPTTAKGVADVLGAGATPGESLPFEILEAHGGAALTPDELLDFHESLAEICCVPPELEKAA